MIKDRLHNAGDRKRTRMRAWRVLPASLLVFVATSTQSFAQVRFKPSSGLTAPSQVQPAQAPAPADPAAAAPPGGAAAGGAGGTAGGTKGAAAGGAKGTKAQGDTTNLPQFEDAMEFQPRNPNDRVAFSLEDADLPELVRVIGQLTGKRFIFGGKVRSIKATVYSPQKVTVAEAYQAFLSILDANGMTVVPHGRFLKIIDTAGAATQGTPLYGAGERATNEDRYITRIHRLQNVSATEVSEVLGKFKSKDADITVYAPGNLLIITDTGTNIRRMMQIVQDVDVGGSGVQIWIEPVHYASASDVASRLNDVFELKGGGSPAPSGGKGGGAPAASSGGGNAGGGDLHIAKIVADDRSNSLVIVATERAYLRLLEFIKKIDLPHAGEGEIHVLPLEHADAVELSKTITEIITGTSQAGAQGGQNAQPKPGTPPSGIFESGIKVSPDKATNSLVVTSSPRDYAALRAVIDKLDQPRRQVFIEAAIMDLSIKRSNSLGFNWHGGVQADFPDGKQTLIFGGLNPLKSALPPDPTSLQGAALGVRGPAIPGSEAIFGTSIPAFGAIISAIASTGDADVLSTPHILATDNIPAEINVGENVPLQQSLGFPSLPIPGVPGAAGGAAGGLGALGALGGFGAFGGAGQRLDVGTKVKIIPHLNQSDEVRLELTEEISEAQAPQGTAQVVPITKRTAQTQLVVKDQQTVVIGGLMRNRLANSVDKIPLLGDIPVLGALFRTTKKEMQKTNLVLVLTPYIIREQNDLRTVFERKMQERQEFLDRYFIFSEDSDYKPPRDYSRTSGLLEDIRQNYLGVEEKKKLDELTRPRELRTHEPGQPVEMPNPRGRGAPGTQGAGGNAPAGNPGSPSQAQPTAPAPNINVAPQPRNIQRLEQ